MPIGQTPPTLNDLILSALKDAGIVGEGQTASAEAMNTAFDAANGMFGQWSKQRWLTYVLNTYGPITATGAISYTVGPGGDIATTVRPSRIESAYFRQTTGEDPYTVDYPLTMIDSREDYNGIRTKELQSFPEYAFYESDWPLGNLYLWPIPVSIYTFFISVMQPLGGYTALTQSMNLPPEYYDAFESNLAVRLCIRYSIPVPADLSKWAKVTLSVLRRANAQIPTLKQPKELLRRGIYNPYADTMR
jgi:hypothetical protein